MSRGLVRSLTRAALVCALASAACGCRGGPIEWERWGIAPPGPEAGAELRKKAELWEERLFAHAISPEGVLLYRMPIEPHLVSGPYEDLADQACWTGYLLAALCFRHHVEPSTETAAVIGRVFAGMRLLHDVTGTRGYIARCVVPAEVAPAIAHDPSVWRPARGDESLWYRSDTSKDQYSGFVFGLTACALLAPDARERAGARELLRAVASHVAAAGLAIRDESGEITNYGDLSPRIVGVPIGVNAAIALAILRAPMPDGLDAETAAEFRRHARRARGALRPLHFEVFGIRNYSNDLMVMAAMLALGLGESHPERRAELRAALEPFLAEFRGEGNALVASLAALHQLRDSEEEMNALRNLLEAPTDLRIRGAPPALYDGLPRRWLSDRKGRARAANALPLSARGVGTFAWKTDPYVLQAQSSTDLTHIASGVDFFLAYWLGRYSGWVPAPARKLAHLPNADRTGT